MKADELKLLNEEESAASPDVLEEAVSTMIRELGEDPAATGRTSMKY